MIRASLVTAQNYVKKYLNQGYTLASASKSDKLVKWILVKDGKTVTVKYVYNGWVDVQ